VLSTSVLRFNVKRWINEIISVLFYPLLICTIVYYCITITFFVYSSSSWGNLTL